MIGGNPIRVHVHGAGKMGSALVRGLRGAGWYVSQSRHRRGRPRRVFVDAVVLCVRDTELSNEASAWVDITNPDAVVLHTAGSQSPDVLGVLRGHCGGVGQLHPLVSIASRSLSPKFDGVYALVGGDAAAVRVARAIALALRMKPWRLTHGDRLAYHAAASLVAGGGAALCAAASDILSRCGVAHRRAERMFAVLLGSVAQNAALIGFPSALSGVVRRGDVVTFRRHVGVLNAVAPEHLGLYLAASREQIAMLRELREVDTGRTDQFDAEIAIARNQTTAS